MIERFTFTANFETKAGMQGCNFSEGPYCKILAFLFAKTSDGNNEIATPRRRLVRDAGFVYWIRNNYGWHRIYSTFVVT